MDSKSFKSILIVITITSLIASIFFGSDIAFDNITNVLFSYPHFKNIVFSISASVFSSTILLWGFDLMNRQKQEKEEQYRREIFYKKITPILNQYYDFYLKLFKSTRTELISEDHKVLHSLFDCKEEFEKQLIDIEPFYKKGYMLRSNTSEKLEVLRKNMTTEEECKKLFEENTMRWYECWTIEAKECNNLLSTIIDNFSYFLPVNLLDDMIILNEKIKIHSGVKEFFEWTLSDGHSGTLHHIPLDFILHCENFFETLELLEKCMSFIEEEIKKELRLRDMNFFNEGNISPTLGHNCKFKELKENKRGG